MPGIRDEFSGVSIVCVYMYITACQGSSRRITTFNFNPCDFRGPAGHEASCSNVHSFFREHGTALQPMIRPTLH